MEVYLLRHTETHSNKNQQADSQIDSDLTSAGQKASNKLVSTLTNINPDRIYISPLKRTRATIQPYLDICKNPKVIVSRLLLERDLGTFTGTPMGTFQKYCDDNEVHKVSTRPPEGESLVDVYSKALRFKKELQSLDEGETVLVCGHKNNLMCLQIALERKDILDYYSFEPFETGELRKFEL